MDRFPVDWAVFSATIIILLQCEKKESCICALKRQKNIIRKNGNGKETATRLCGIDYTEVTQ